MVMLTYGLRKIMFSFFFTDAKNETKLYIFLIIIIFYTNKSENNIGLLTYGLRIHILKKKNLY